MIARTQTNTYASKQGSTAHKSEDRHWNKLMTENAYRLQQNE